MMAAGRTLERREAEGAGPGRPGPLPLGGAGPSSPAWAALDGAGVGRFTRDALHGGGDGDASGPGWWPGPVPGGAPASPWPACAGWQSWGAAVRADDAVRLGRGDAGTADARRAARGRGGSREEARQQAEERRAASWQRHVTCYKGR
jgi:hypothetical protein